jgi:hypothetical protein
MLALLGQRGTDKVCFSIEAIRLVLYFLFIASLSIRQSTFVMVFEIFCLKTFFVVRNG